MKNYIVIHFSTDGRNSIERFTKFAQAYARMADLLARDIWSLDRMCHVRKRQHGFRVYGCGVLAKAKIIKCNS